MPKLRSHKRDTSPDWTRWKFKGASIVSMRKDKILAEPSEIRGLERCAGTRRRFAKRSRVVAVTTGPFFDPRSSTRALVGANLLKEQKWTQLKHYKPRSYLVSPPPKSQDKLRIVDTLAEVKKLYRQGRVRYVYELGAKVFPEVQAGLKEADWLTIKTERYVVAEREPNKFLVIYMNRASISDIRALCRSLKVDQAFLFDGGSSIKYGSWIHVVFAVANRPAS